MDGAADRQAQGSLPAARGAATTRRAIASGSVAASGLRQNREKRSSEARRSRIPPRGRSSPGPRGFHAPSRRHARHASRDTRARWRSILRLDRTDAPLLRRRLSAEEARGSSTPSPGMPSGRLCSFLRSVSFAQPCRGSSWCRIPLIRMRPQDRCFDDRSEGQDDCGPQRRSMSFSRSSNEPWS